jgi:hypothetical protein
VSALGSRRLESCDLLNGCVLAVNQPPGSALLERSWRRTPAVPGRWRHEFARTAFRIVAQSGTQGTLPLPLVLGGEEQCQTVKRRAFGDRGWARIQVVTVEASAGALHETVTTALHGSGRPTGGRDG